MKLTITDAKTGGDLLLINGEKEFDRFFYSRDKDNKYFTIAWNRGEKQTVTIDGTPHEFLPHTILTLLFNQSFYFENAAGIVAWQFNREFYCIIDHDAEVSCVGFLFAGTGQIFISLNEEAKQKMRLLLDIFTEELHTKDVIQNEMLLVLLKRLIIFITKLGKSTYLPSVKLNDEKIDIFRKFNLLVEGNFKTERSVSYYANCLNKSPKTLANVFALYNKKTPQQMIQERVVMEAKRLLLYTGKSVKEIAYELNFEDPAYFSNFFKRHVSQSPAEFKAGK